MEHGGGKGGATQEAERNPELGFGRAKCELFSQISMWNAK